MIDLKEKAPTPPLALSVLEKKNMKRRLSSLEHVEYHSDEEADQGPPLAQRPGVISSDAPQQLEGPGLPPKVPLIQPKTEPEEQESKWLLSDTSTLLN